MSQKVVSRAALFVNVFESLESGAFFNHFEGVGISCGFRISNCLYVKHSHKRNTLIIKSANIKAKQQTNDETRRKNVASRRKCQRTKPERAPQEQRQQKKRKKERDTIHFCLAFYFNSGIQRMQFLAMALVPSKNLQLLGVPRVLTKFPTRAVY